MFFDGWKFIVILVIGIHAMNLFPRGCSEDLDNFNQLIDSALARKNRCTEYEFGHNTTGGPHVNGCSVKISTKYEFGSTIVARANVRYILLGTNEDFCTTKVTQP